MTKIVIDLPYEVHTKLINIANTGNDIPLGLQAELVRAVVNGAVLDKNCDLISRQMLIKDFEKDPPDPEGVDEWIDIVECQPRIL